jgi:hypothetical protein
MTDTQATIAMGCLFWFDRYFSSCLPSFCDCLLFLSNYFLIYIGIFDFRCILHAYFKAHFFFFEINFVTFILFKLSLFLTKNFDHSLLFYPKILNVLCLLRNQLEAMLNQIVVLSLIFLPKKFLSN